MNAGNKDKVYETYEKIADWYNEHRSQELLEKPYLDIAMAHIKSGAKILDLGCGTGVPITQYFVEQGYQ